MSKTKIHQLLKVKYFRNLHYQKDILILPNAWDALSAKICELSGAKAIATTSAGISSCLGFPDGEYIPHDLFFMMIKRIIDSVNIPVTVDIESGMCNTIAELSNNIRHLINIGAVGINIEDSRYGELIPIQEQVEKISAIRQLIINDNSDVFINARIDTYWLSINRSQDCFDETLKRLKAYQKAGADGIFIPNLTDLFIIQNILEVFESWTRKLLEKYDAVYIEVHKEYFSKS